MITRTGRSVLRSVTALGLGAREAPTVRFVIIKFDHPYHHHHMIARFTFTLSSLSSLQSSSSSLSPPGLKARGALIVRFVIVVITNLLLIIIINIVICFIIFISVGRKRSADCEVHLHRCCHHKHHHHRYHRHYHHYRHYHYHHHHCHQSCLLEIFFDFSANDFKLGDILQLTAIAALKIQANCAIYYKSDDISNCYRHLEFG